MKSREEAKTKDATEIAVHEVSYEVETGSRLRVMACMVNTPHTYWGIPRSVWQPLDIQRVLLGRPAPSQESLCLCVSVPVLAGSSTTEDLVKGRRKKKFLGKESGDQKDY